MNLSIRKIAAIAFAAMLSFSCKNPDTGAADVSFSVYDNSGETPKTIESPARGLVNYQLRVISSTDWRLDAGDASSWVSITPSSGTKGARQLSMTVSENKEEISRSALISFYCADKQVASFAVNQAKAEPQDSSVIIPPVSADVPVADLLDVLFKNDGTGFDNSQSQMEIETVSGAAAVSYFNDHYERYVAHFNHTLGSGTTSGYYKIDYTNNANFQKALADGHTLEVLFRMDAANTGASEVKMFSSMQAGGTGFLITTSSRGKSITFLPNVSTTGKSSWKWTESGIVPEVGRYYHVIGVWDKNKGKSRIYVDGELKSEIDAKGDLVFPTEGNTWFCVGGDPSSSSAHSAFNGDVAIARVYDDPLTQEQVNLLYEEVKTDAVPQVITLSDISYQPSGNVAKGCYFYIYGKGFKDGDIVRFESLTDSALRMVCDTKLVTDGLRVTIPMGIISGGYRLTLVRGDVIYPIGSTTVNVVSELNDIRTTKVVAHRGYHPGSVTENSMASLIEAQKLGVYGSEFDVYVTTDDVVVLYHNATLTNDGRRLDSCTYDEIKDYKLANGESLPTLDQYLEQAKKYPNVKLILEIKPHNSAEKNMRAAAACVSAVKAHGLVDQVEYISFNYDICKKVVELSPGSMVQYLNGNLAPSVCYADGIMGIDYNSSKLKDEWITEAHSLGMIVNVWTVNNKSEMLKFISKGVDLLTTDECEVALGLLERPFVTPAE